MYYCVQSVYALYTVDFHHNTGYCNHFNNHSGLRSIPEPENMNIVYYFMKFVKFCFSLPLDSSMMETHLDKS